MSKKIYGNPNDVLCFEETSFITKKTKNLTPYQQQFLHLYEGSMISSPTIGRNYSLVFKGKSNGDWIFDGGFKDFVRVEDKTSERKYIENLSQGDVMEVLITDIIETPFIIQGSVATIYETKIQEELISLDEDEYIIGYIKESTPAGYNVSFDYFGVNLVGFMPNTLAGINKLIDSESIVGTKMELGVESYSKEEGTYIVSRRKYLQSLIPSEIKKLNYGQVYRGSVTGRTDFGVFVEWNECLTGMIHKTNLNPEYKLSEIEPGMVIEFYIKEVIKDKIILTQVLKDSLWDTIKVGMLLNGKVKDNKQFGTLVILDEETTGLIHTSEIEKIGENPSEGSEIEVKVIAVDRMSRKIFLTIPNKK